MWTETLGFVRSLKKKKKNSEPDCAVMSPVLGYGCRGHSSVLASEGLSKLSRLEGVATFLKVRSTENNAFWVLR